MHKIDLSREEYLKAIFYCMEEGGYATNKQLSEILGVSPASVTEMIRKMSEEVYIEKKSIYLTQRGVEEVKRLLTKHRLWEIFLVKHLGYQWHEVHEEADALEHATSDKLKDRLNIFLGNPVHCPHGSEVYENHIEKDDLRHISQLQEGESAIIHKVSDDRALLEYLASKELRIGQKIQVRKIDDFDESMLLESEGKEIWIAQKAVEKIMVI